MTPAFPYGIIISRKKRKGSIAMETKLKALDPRGHFNVVQRAPLSPRLSTLAGKTVYIINSWPGDTHGFVNV